MRAGRTYPNKPVASLNKNSIQIQRYLKRALTKTIQMFKNVVNMYLEKSYKVLTLLVSIQNGRHVLIGHICHTSFSCFNLSKKIIFKMIYHSGYTNLSNLSL